MAKPGRRVMEQQEHISPNLQPTIKWISVFSTPLWCKGERARSLFLLCEIHCRRVCIRMGCALCNNSSRAVGFNRENYTYTTNETADRLIAPHTDCYKTLPRFCEDLVSVFSALSEVAWVSTKDCQQTHPIWEGFFSEAL